VSEKNIIDAYAPAEIAALVESAGVRKAGLGTISTLTLGVLAGAFIAFGGMFFTLVLSDGDLSVSVARILGGVCFSLGLILVVIGGAELFTGNNLIVMAWADGKVSLARLLRNWGLVYVGNFVGALATVAIAYFAGVQNLTGGAYGETAQKIAEAKIDLPFAEAFFRGLLCNVLVCLAVWLTIAAHSVASKILAIVFPITACVALGFEHSVANMYLIPFGLLQSDFMFSDGVLGLIMNLIPVTIGNIVGGSGFVAMVYWLVYLRN
jgi:formate/nitrite transporter